MNPAGPPTSGDAVPATDKLDRDVLKVAAVVCSASAMMPIMVAALQKLWHDQVARASTATNTIQQLFGAIGAAVMSIVLAALPAKQFGVPTSQGPLAATTAPADPGTHDTAARAVAESFASTLLWALVLMVVCLVPAFLLPRRAVASDESRPGSTPVLAGH